MTVFQDNRPSGIDQIAFKAIACGQSHCLALTVTGAVFSWGCGLNGRLGHGDQIGSAFPEQIVAIAHLIVDEIACGDAHSACITDEGRLYVWGASGNRRLGFANMLTVDTDVPTLNDYFADTLMSRVWLGLNNSFAVTRGNELFAWGSPSYGKQGMPGSAEAEVLVPYKLYLKGTQNVHQLAAGPFHSLALSRDGELYTFGSSNEGKLGIFRLEERMVGRGMGGDGSGLYTIDWPWKLTEAVPPKFFQSTDDNDVFEHYVDFNTAFTS